VKNNNSFILRGIEISGYASKEELTLPPFLSLTRARVRGYDGTPHSLWNTDTGQRRTAYYNFISSLLLFSLIQYGFQHMGVGHGANNPTL
jgi:hypothetical protein